MLIPFHEICDLLRANQRVITGILHIGAHECEERKAYNDQGITDDQIYWVEGNPEKVKLNQDKGVPHIYQALIHNEETEVDFYITKNLYNPGNTESSSILPLGVHQFYYPHVQIQETKKLPTIRLDTLIQKEHIPIQTLNFWNLDIQGVELEALMSAGEFLRFADVIYVEVNEQPLYQGCALLPQLEAFLNKQGFQLVGKKMTEQGWGDALFLRV
jgi:hypothetical protein